MKRLRAFAYVYYPRDEKEWLQYYEGLKYTPSFLRRFGKKICSLKEASCLPLEGNGNKVEGKLLICPSLGNKMTDKIKNWCEVNEIDTLGCEAALENLRCKIENSDQKKVLWLPTGEIFKAVFFLDGLKKELEERKENIQHLHITIDGATTYMGQFCAYLLAHEVRFMTLIDDQERNVDRLTKRILRETGLAAKNEGSLHKALPQTDILVCARPISTTILGIIPEKTMVCCLDRGHEEEQSVIKKDFGEPCLEIPERFLASFQTLPACELESPIMAETIFSTLEYSFIKRYIRTPLQVMQIENLIKRVKQYGFAAKGLRELGGG